MAEEKKPEEKAAPGKAEGKQERPTPKDNLVVTKHSVKIGGREIKYTVCPMSKMATAQNLNVRLPFHSMADLVLPPCGCISVSWARAA